MASIRFTSFLKVWLACASAAGFALAILSIVAALAGWDVTSSIIVVRAQGITAGFVNLVWLPVFLSFLALLLSPLAYYPFRVALGFAGRIRLEQPPTLDEHTTPNSRLEQTPPAPPDGAAQSPRRYAAGLSRLRKGR